MSTLELNFSLMIKESNQHLSHVATHSVSNVPMEYLLIENLENAQIAVRSFTRKIFDKFISPRH